MPEIEAFAEIGDYIDQPVRMYSSGMQMRLAFSVATARRPDVLIVDEALSVGDAYFQHKSFDRIRAFRKHGTTLLIVSHDKQAIQTICDRAILLDGGRLAKEGDPEAVMDFYNALLADRAEPDVVQQATRRRPGRRPSPAPARRRSSDIALLNDAGRARRGGGRRCPSDAAGEGGGACADPAPGARLHDQGPAGASRCSAPTPIYRRCRWTDVRAGESIDVSLRVSQSNLGPGSYSVATALCSTDTHLVNNYEWRDLALLFNVVNMTRKYFAGCTWLDACHRDRSA